MSRTCQAVVAGAMLVFLAGSACAASVTLGHASPAGITATITPDGTESGTLDVYIGALYNGQWYLRNGVADDWRPLGTGALPVAGQILASGAQSIEVSVTSLDLSPLVGLEVYVAYGHAEADIYLPGHFAKIHTVPAPAGSGEPSCSFNVGAMALTGSWYTTGNQWPHDGRPCESENFVIYSDGAGDDAKKEIATIAEEALRGIKDLLGIESNATFLYPPGQTKIDIFAYRNRPVREWGGWSYYGGFLIFSLDHPERTDWGDTRPERYNPTLVHELTHVVEFLLKGDGDLNSIDFWFAEGLAETVSGGTAGGSITRLQKFNELRDRYGSLNPVSMHRFVYPNVELIGYFYYYPMFQLAVQYLADNRGHGMTPVEGKNLLLDSRDGVPFSTAFQNRFGMSLFDFENRFFDLMNAYLP